MHEVKTKEDNRLFLEMPIAIYKNDSNWIRPLDKDIEDVFDTAKNKFFKHGECSRWILFDNNNQIVGRVAAFINKKYKQSQPTGGIGFFECINNQQAAHFIFDHCKQWLLQRGMEAMDGPINFGERDRWWGLLSEGFDEPLYCMNYNPPYYKTLMESYGFELFFNQICYGMKTKDSLQEKFFIRHNEVAHDAAFSAKMIDKNRLDQFAKDFAIVYNKAWASHGDNKQIDERTVVKMFEQMKSVMDETLIWFAYYHTDPIAMFVNLPDINQYFKYLNGRFGWLQKIQFVIRQKFGKCRRCVGLVFGVVPEHQGKGVDSYLIVEAAKVIQKKVKYEDYEMQWIGDFNPKMMNIAENLGAHPTRKLITYRYLFDRSLEFKRHPIIGV
jgi:hypothetical protein